MSQLHELSRPFPDAWIKPPAPGRYGSYVAHSTVTERLLSIVGPFTFTVDEPIRGHAPKIDGKNQTWPSRPDAIVGCVASLTVTIDGRQVTITEVGDVDEPAMNLDGFNLKVAASDAIKRCSMRIGLGLHLWSQDLYFLESQLSKGEATDTVMRGTVQAAPDERGGHLRSTDDSIVTDADTQLDQPQDVV